MSRAVRRPHLAVLAAFLSGVAACFSAGCRKFRSFLLHVSWYFWRWARCLLGWFRLLWPWQLLLFLLKFFNLILLLTRTSRRSKSFIGTLPDEHNPKSSQSPTKTALGGEALGSSQPHLNHPADHHLVPGDPQGLWAFNAFDAFAVGFGAQSPSRIHGSMELGFRVEHEPSIV